MMDMDEDSRQQLFQKFTTIKFPCSRHADEIANMFINDEESQYKGFICATCYANIVQTGTKMDGIVTPTKFIISQIHQTCSKLMTQLSISSFVDYYLTNTLHLARQFSSIKQSILQASILNFFKKYRNYLNGNYFEQYYSIIKQITLNHNSKIYNKERFTLLASKRLVQFIIAFNRLIMQCEDYSALSFQQKLNGKFLVKQIKMEIEQVYKQIKDKISKLKKNQNNEQQILQMLTPNQGNDCSKFYRFSAILTHPNISIVQPKKMKMPNNMDNQHTILSLIEPSIGSKKKSINFKMDGIKGWVSIGIAIRKKVEQNAFKFESTSSHGTFQISYDGYSWSDDSSSNQQYTSWYYNEGDTVNLTVNPPTNELTFTKNNDTSNPYVLKFKSEKKDKLHFCVAVNYNQDSVSIVQ